MGKSCVCPGCRTGYISKTEKKCKIGLKIPSLFSVPKKNPALLESWENAIPGLCKKLTLRDHVCAKHFKPEDIQHFLDEVKLPDGSIFRLKRDRPLLKPGAIPCYFPDEPIVRNSKKMKEKSKEPKKISASSTSPLPASSPLKQEKSKRKKSSSPGKSEKRKKEGKKNKLKKNSSIQLGKENILFEGIIFEPIPQEQPTAEPVLSNKGSDIETEMDCTLSNLQNDLRRQSKSSFFNSSTPALNQSFLFKERGDTNNELDSTSASFEDSSIIKPESPFMDPSIVDSDLAEECSVPVICENILSESNVVLPKSVVEEQFSFNFLKININMVDIINSWWKVNVLDDFISFIRWTPDYTIERKIVITKDLAVKVFLYDVESTIGKDLEVISIDAISKLIFRVERTKICPRITEKDGNCAGFLQGVFQCKKYNLCLNCIKWEKEQKKMLMRPVKIPNNLVELIRFNFNE